MNESTLILTETRRLPRLFDAALTLIAWCGFLVFLYANLLMQFTTQGARRWELIAGSFNLVLAYLLFAVLNGWLLIVWYHYNRRRRPIRRHASLAALAQDELASSVDVAPHLISEMSQYNLLTVYHDGIGRIIDLKINRQETHEE